MTISRFKLLNLFVLSILFCPSTAFAADAPAKLPNPVIAIVDVQRILQESMAAKSVQKQMDAQRAKIQTEIEGEENNLRNAEQDLAGKRDKIAAQDYADQEQQLRQRFATVESRVQAQRKSFDQSFTDSMNAVRGALLDVVDHTARDHGANIVIVKQQALWTDQPLDITDEVLKKLDQKLPRVDIKMPLESPAP